MENLESYKKRIKAIEELSNRLESGELSIDELVTLETLTRELYERTVILKYKAFENKVNPVIEKSMEIVEEKEIEEDTFENEIEESEPTIEFSIFDAPAETEEVEPELTASSIEQETIVLQLEDEDIPESSITEVAEKVELEDMQERVPETIVQEEAVVESHNSAQVQSFWEQLNINNNSLSNQFEGAKIDTLVGAFGLNEKLGYINELFDGSSESFSEAIKVLDSQSNLDSAKVKASELALKHGWDAEEESVVDFLIMVNRRYA